MGDPQAMADSVFYLGLPVPSTEQGFTLAKDLLPGLFSYTKKAPRVWGCGRGGGDTACV